MRIVHIDIRTLLIEPQLLFPADLFVTEDLRYRFMASLLEDATDMLCPDLERHLSTIKDFVINRDRYNGLFVSSPVNDLFKLIEDTVRKVSVLCRAILHDFGFIDAFVTSVSPTATYICVAIEE